MRPRRLVWQLFPSYLLLILLALGAVSWYASRTLRDFYLEQTAIDLEARARLTAQMVSSADGDALDALSKRLGQKAGTRLTIILPSGVVAGDSAEDPARMENHAGRPEVAAALGGQVGNAIRFSHTMQTEMMYVAVPAPFPEIGVVRTALPLDAIDLTVQQFHLRIALGGMAVAALAGLVSLAIARRISRPLEEMRRGAVRFAEGDLEKRLAVSGSEEIGALAEAMNRMAQQLDERMRTVVRQQKEQEAVFASMVEGVLAIDTEERILRLNRAAARLLRVHPETAQGRRIQEVVRKADLLRFVARALAGREPVEEDLVLRHQEEERYLQAHGTPLRDAEGREIGVLIVLNDVTRLRRLENIRRDFVANVSHELKTPITAIKGFVETLQDGALEDSGAARRFLGILTRQADRLNAIIEDLLDLSRIEAGVEQGAIALAREPLRPALEAAVQACSVAAAEKTVQVNLFCSPELTARVNPPLLEQAVVNLLTNAVKYSPTGGKVVVDAAQLGERVMIRIRDWGVGIAPEHLPRLFERFYRVDKARSRSQGGTGLGLAIVKHIVQAHNGEVVVNSFPNEGSTFTIILPA